jgi:hypothetical protein
MKDAAEAAGASAKDAEAALIYSVGQGPQPSSSAIADRVADMQEEAHAQLEQSRTLAADRKTARGSHVLLSWHEALLPIVDEEACKPLEPDGIQVTARLHGLLRAAALSADASEAIESCASDARAAQAATGGARMEAVAAVKAQLEALDAALGARLDAICCAFPSHVRRNNSIFIPDSVPDSYSRLSSPEDHMGVTRLKTISPSEDFRPGTRLSVLQTFGGPYPRTRNLHEFAQLRMHLRTLPC